MMARLRMPLKSLWSEVQAVRERVEMFLAHLPDDIRAAAVMTTSELVENAIKYGESVPKAPEATVELDCLAGRIEIRVKNGVRGKEVVRELQGHIERLSGADDRMALYVSRLRELLTCDVKSGSKLGLYRIGYEGGFQLRCDYVDDVVTMIATRRDHESKSPVVGDSSYPPSNE